MNWLRLQDVPDRYMSNFIQIDKNTLITAPSNSGCSLFPSSEGIKKYDIHNDEWSTLIEYPSYHESNTSSICYNKTKSELCILGNEKFITKINLSTKQFEKFKVDKFCGRYPSLSFINNQYHIICGSWSMHHYIWNEIKLKFQSVFKFDGLSKGIQCHGLVHIESKKQLILFGGLDKTNVYLDAIWKCQYTTATETQPVYKWNKLDLRLPFRMHSFGYILTDDERFILIFGGKIQSLHFLNDIYIFDIKEMVITKCGIDCPENHSLFVLKGMKKAQHKFG